MAIALLPAIAISSVPACDAQAQDIPELTSTQIAGSSTRYVEAVAHARKAGYAAVLARYDRFLAARPWSVHAAIERCRFVAAIGGADEQGELDAKARSCAADLTLRYPTSFEAAAFHFDQHWGIDAVAFGEDLVRRLGSKQSWSGAEIARAYAKVARAHFEWGEDRASFVWATQARLIDPSVDTSVVLAYQLFEWGKRKSAIHELSRPGGDPADEPRKIGMLVELSAYPEALLRIEKAIARGDRVDAWMHARALEGTGKLEQARKAYRELLGKSWTKRHVLRRLFYLELKLGDRETATIAYRELRAAGLEADPVGRHRLALAARYPLAPWVWKECLGFLQLIALCVLAVLLPLLWVAPIHYLSLARRQDTRDGPFGDRWSLLHVWAVSAGLLLVQIVAMYVFESDQLASAFFGTDLEARASQSVMANTLVLTVVGSSVIALAALRKGDYGRLIRSRWDVVRTTLIVLVSGAAVMVVHASTHDGGLEWRWLGWLVEAPDASYASVEMLRAVATVHGPWVAVPLVAVAVPIYEEIFFRSVLLGSFARHVPFFWANLGQAGLFVAAHDHPERYPGLFALALLSGWVVKRGGGLAPAIALHAGLNLLAMMAILIGVYGPVDLRNPWSTNRELSNRLRVPAHTWTSADELAGRCEAGQLDACLTLAHRYREGVGVPQDFGLGAQLARMTCGEGLAAGCNLLGWATQQAEGVPPTEGRTTEAAVLYRQACDGGNATGCGNLADLYAAGLGVEHNLDEAVRLYRKSCDSKEMAACVNLGNAYAKGEGVAKDPAIAAGLYERACDAGRPAGCTNLASLHDRFKESPRAAELYRRVCDLGDASGCNELGRRYQYGDGVPADAAAAARLYEKACDGGNASGCDRLGRLYSDGKGVPHDDHLAATLYEKACDAGDGSGCNNLGVHLFGGRGVPMHRASAARLYQRACELKNAKGCSNAARMVARGDGVSGDQELAASLRRKACELGIKDDCETR